jgi:hypothetical protein
MAAVSLTRLGLFVAVLSRVSVPPAVTVWAVTPVVVVSSDVMVPPASPAALNVMVGTLVFARPFWKVMVNGPLPPTTVLLAPTFGRALRKVWMLDARVAGVALQGIGAVVSPLNVRVKVPPLMPAPKVSVCTALTPPGEARMPVTGAAVSVVGLLTINPAIWARVPLPLSVRVPPWMLAVPVLVFRFASTRLPAPPLIREPPPLMFPVNVNGIAGLRVLIVLGRPLSRPALVGVAAAGMVVTLPPVSGPEYCATIAAPPVIWKDSSWKECSPGASRIGVPLTMVVVTPTETTEVPSM